MKGVVRKNRQGLFQELFYLVKLLHFGLIAEGEGRSRLPGAGRTSYPVNVILGLVREVEIDDVVDVGNVDTTCRDVGRHEYFDTAGVEARQGLPSRGLCFIAVKRIRFEAFLRQLSRQAVRLVLRPREHERP